MYKRFILAEMPFFDSRIHGRGDAYMSSKEVLGPVTF
jgi:hypothetical protein